MRTRSIVLRLAALSAVCAAALWFWLGSSVQDLRVVVLDVGQGDAILIRTPGNNDILIDGGPDGRVVERLSANLPGWDKTLELVVLTHPDLDHVGGLPEVAQSYTIERVLETEVRSPGVADTAWERELAQQHAQRLLARAGTALALDRVKLEVLWPQSEKDLETKQRNDTSVVVRLTYGETSWLLTSDISSAVEERLVQSGTLTDVDVLKVPHHGSISSSSQEFLEAVKPEVAVISVGKRNKFGHPHPVVVRRLKQRGANVLRTDEIGDVVCQSNGQDIQCNP